MLDLRGEDGERGSGGEATEERVGEVDGDEAHLEQAHENLQERDEQESNRKQQSQTVDSWF